MFVWGTFYKWVRVKQYLILHLIYFVQYASNYNFILYLKKIVTLDIKESILTLYQLTNLIFNANSFF